MRFNQQIKKGARSALKGSRGKAAAIFMMCTGVWLLLASTESLLYQLFGYTGYTDIMLSPGYYLDDVLNHQLGQILITSVVTLLGLFIYAPLLCGIVSWYHRLTGADSTAFGGIFRYFSSLRLFVRSLGLAVMFTVRSFLWLLLFMALPTAIVCFFQWYSFPVSSPLTVLVTFCRGAGWLLMGLFFFFYLVFIQRYFLAPYLLADKPGIRLNKAFQKSVRMMQGRCWELLSLRLSFFGWGLLSLLAVPALYAVPYYRASLSIYARYVMEYHGRTARPDTQLELPQPEEASGPFADRTKEYPVADLQQHLDSTR